nr:reverse transcriptase domain-containing protein [Tanacetum cinerariifolium]
MEVDLVQYNEDLEVNLDLLEERKEEEAIHEAKSKAKIEKYYNLKVRNTSFKPGDLLYCNNDASQLEDTGKLGPKWEGPYETNGLIERANQSLEEGIKARLDARSKNWMEELPHAVISTKIGMPTLRTMEVDLVQYNEALEVNLDLLEERKEEEAIHEAK